MVTADYKVGASVVFPHHCMEYRLSWSSITHCCREDTQEGPVSRIIVLQECQIALHPHIGRNIIRFGLTHQRVQEQRIYNLHSTLLNVLMGTMHRITRLEAYNGSPALFGEDLARLCRIEIELSELRRLRTVKDCNRASDISRWTGQELTDTRVLGICGFEHILCLDLLVYTVDALDIQQTVDDAVFFTNQRDSVANSKTGSHFILDSQRNRNAPYCTIGETHTGYYRMIVFFIQEAGKRRKCPDTNEIQIGYCPSINCN